MPNKRGRNSGKQGKSNDDLRRSRNNKEPRQYILIVVEGDTEYNYFTSLNKLLKLPTTKVELVKGKGGSPLVIVKKACDLCNSNNYDKIFSVFDGDKPEEYKKALEQVKKFDITAIPSIPCFEFWFLLHYQYNDRPFEKCKDVIFELKNNWIQDYDKAMDIYSVLKPRLDKAIANAERLEQQQTEQQQKRNIDCANPLTKVHHLVKYLQDQKDYKSSKH
ncbi:MAG: RloB domain-containing protein [Moorea sp. SIO3C2]|nr:RloB domain-containing protein [Moorena sp. SIO3C2]